jgi:very-short-patch-repair endonuclease
MAKKQRSKTFRKITKRIKRVDIHEYARLLRLRMTKAELLLWGKLRAVMKSWNVEFECQGVIAGRFIADFVCREKRLIIEVDGSIHQLSRVRAKDNYRSMVLARLGYKIIRFSNNEVFKQTTKVINSILLSLNN